MNVVSEYKRKSIEELLERGVGLREIARRLVIDRSTVRRSPLVVSGPTILMLIARLEGKYLPSGPE
jgi:hypothetical protein